MAKKTIHLRNTYSCDRIGPNWCGMWELEWEADTKVVKLHGDIGDLLNLAHAVREMVTRYQDHVRVIEEALKGDG